MNTKKLYNSIAHQLPLFLQPWWLDTVCNGFWSVALISDNDGVVAVWPYQLERKWIFKLIRNPLLTPYLGPFFLQKNLNSQQREKCFQDLLLQLPNADMVQWTGFPGDSNQTDFYLEAKAAIKVKRTYILDLNQNQEQIWQNIHSKRKNDIRKAQAELQIKQVPLDWNAFKTQHQFAFEQKDTYYPYSFNLFQKIDKALQNNQASVGYQAVDSADKIQAQALFVFDKSTMYYLLSAACTKPHRGAVAAIVWQAICEAQNRGLRYFDFEGSMDKGIAQFFQRFGGTLHNYNYYEQCNSLLWKLKKTIKN